MIARWAVLFIVAIACGGEEPTGDVDDAFRCRTALDVPASCATCIEQHCCDEAIACGEDFACKACVQPGDSTQCDWPAPDAAWALTDCEKAHCGDVCPPPFAVILAAPACDLPEELSVGECALGSAFACNPVSNKGCEPPASCDSTGCWPVGNIRNLCDPCGYVHHEGCVAGHTCLGQCARFCCSDAECGSGRCDTTIVANLFLGQPPAPDLGVCVEGP